MCTQQIMYFMPSNAQKNKTFVHLHLGSLLCPRRRLVSLPSHWAMILREPDLLTNLVYKNRLLKMLNPDGQMYSLKADSRVQMSNPKHDNTVSFTSDKGQAGTYLAFRFGVRVNHKI